MFLAWTLLNNLNITMKNPKDEKLVEKQWSLKWPTLGSGAWRPTQHEHTPLFALKLDFDEDDGAPSERKQMGVLEERHHSKRGRLKVKQLLRSMCITNVQLEIPFITRKKLLWLSLNFLMPNIPLSNKQKKAPLGKNKKRFHVATSFWSYIMQSNENPKVNYTFYFKATKML